MNFYQYHFKITNFLLALISPTLVLAASSDGPATLDMITSPVGIACLLLFNCLRICYGRRIYSLQSQNLRDKQLYGL